MFFLATAAAFLFLGYEIAVRMWRNETLIERLAAAGLLGVLLWLASVWMLALPHILLQPLLLLRVAIVFAVAIFLRLRRSPREPEDPRTRGPLLYVTPILLWLIFIAWRAWLVPPLNHDALSYHLPKAVLFSRAHGFRILDELPSVLRRMPANYEMLLADLVTIEGSDRVTEWLSALLYVLFVITAGALAQRWWQKRETTLAVMLFVAGMPVLLLHSGADKNDLLTGLFMLGALLFAGRWISDGDLPALLLSICAVAAGAGTKPQVFILGAILAPLIAWRLVRERNARYWLAAIAVALAAVVFLGGVPFIAERMHQTAPGPAATGAETKLVLYGDWANLWQAPYVLLAAPFSPNAYELWTPWSGAPWFWRRYEMFFSHFGIPFALCALAAPFAAFRRGAPERRNERIALFLVSGATVAAMLPVYFLPHGLYDISLPRYILFFAAVVIALSVGAALEGRVPKVATWFLGIAATFFIAYAADMAINDRFVPIDYVWWAAKHPGSRSIPFDPYRAAQAMDQRAGPNDKIAVDMAFGSWIHPVFGASLSRPVEFIQPGSGPVKIADDVKWVVVDRSWNAIWANPQFQDLRQADLLSKGQPAPEDWRVINALRKDPRFELVFYRPRLVQAVFRNRKSRETSPAAP